MLEAGAPTQSVLLSGAYVMNVPATVEIVSEVVECDAWVQCCEIGLEVGSVEM
jgi:hypothetical protein